MEIKVKTRTIAKTIAKIRIILEIGFRIKIQKIDAKNWLFFYEFAKACQLAYYLQNL